MSYFMISVRVFWSTCKVILGLRLRILSPQTYFYIVTRIVLTQPALFLTPLNPDYFFTYHQV
jgi:hypothetical protein